MNHEIGAAVLTLFFRRMNKLGVRDSDVSSFSGLPKTPCCVSLGGYATGHGISESDMEVIQSDLFDMYKTGIRVEMRGLKCYEFFNDYWRSLAF